MTEDEIIDIIRYNAFNVTFTGGDPFFQAPAVAQLAQRIKAKLQLNIWCYTGYRWEEIQDNPNYRPLLQHIDVLVDSPFILDLRDTSLRFRGSSNQRLIDVQASLKDNHLIDITNQYK